MEQQIRLQIMGFKSVVMAVMIGVSMQQGWLEYDCKDTSDTATKDNCEVFAEVLFEVTGGESVGADRYPYLVSLQQELIVEKQFNHFCGGVLISDHLVLTVAHCIYQRNTQTETLDYDMRDAAKSSHGTLAHIGNIYAARSPSCRHEEGNGRRKVVEYWIHPDYDGYSINGNDIAILKVESNFDYLGPFPYFDFDNKVDLARPSMTVLGWGATESKETDPLFSSSIVKNLQEAKVNFNPISTCQEEANSVNTDYKIVEGQMLCFVNPESDTCTGDSGGPVLVKECTGLDIVIGLTSWGVDSQCSGQGFSGVYSDISGFKDWIAQTLAEASDGQISLELYTISFDIPTNVSTQQLGVLTPQTTEETPSANDTTQAVQDTAARAILPVQTDSSAIISNDILALLGTDGP
eukprot:TRINITY_DN6868_c0_g1_i4.p1 TRINITY_DN6868_c0_g1~~TRINITY_DN6868_c0_g1_i4.p1  ORF type:complete len:451 (-),score=37.49 TRINITY_DN6868_c0_g1_i4:989-2209(-)